MGFSTMADRVVRLLSLSRDRKWPHVSKYTHSQSLAVGLRLEGNLVVYCNFVQNGTVIIPDVLQPYMDNQKLISKPLSPLIVTFSSLKKERTSEKGLMSSCC